MRKFFLIPALLGLCLAGACPAKQEPADTGKVSGKPVVSPRPVPLAEGESEVAAAGTEATGTSHAPPPEKLDSIPEDGDLVGKWFSLFAKGFGGAHLYSSAEGHTLEFTSEGQVIWSLRGVPNTGPGMRTPYRVEGSEIIISYREDEFSRNTALAAATPLGFGRDKEIGLTSAGRDKEIGLTDEGTALQSGGDKRELRLVMTSDGRYLGLADQYGHLTVYGRETNPGKDFTEGIEGEWHGHAAPNSSFTARFELRGDEVIATLDDGKSKFSGHVVNGYIAGELSGADGVKLAALLPEDTNTINGVTAGGPDWQLQLHFDFSR